MSWTMVQLLLTMTVCQPSIENIARKQSFVIDFQHVLQILLTKFFLFIFDHFYNWNFCVILQNNIKPKKNTLLFSSRRTSSLHLFGAWRLAFAPIAFHRCEWCCQLSLWIYQLSNVQFILHTHKNDQYSTQKTFSFFIYDISTTQNNCYMNLKKKKYFYVFTMYVKENLHANKNKFIDYY